MWYDSPSFELRASRRWHGVKAIAASLKGTGRGSGTSSGDRGSVMPLSRRQLSTPAQNAAEPAWPRARRGRLKVPSDSASDAEDDAEARSGRLESEAELAERRSGGMRGVNPRRAASSGGAT